MEAWVTLATNDTYALGCLVLGQSLRRAGTTKQLHCLVTPGVTQGMREHLGRVFNDLTQVDVLDSGDSANLALISRPELGVTFTKLHCWRLSQYRKCVFLDADILVLRNADELFEREELSAAPDIGWPDLFNSGVFVFVPSEETYQALLQCAVSHGSFDGGDQGLLNTFFADWFTKPAAFRLPVIYNMSSSLVYTYRAAYKRHAGDVKIVHFLGGVKPWQHPFNCETGEVQYRSDSMHILEHVQLWWRIFVDDVKPHMQAEYSGLAGQLAQATLAEVASGDDGSHRRAWESGNIDYTGRDSWENIQRRLDASLSK